MRTQWAVNLQTPFGNELAPLCMGGGVINLETLPAVEVVFLIKMIVNGGMYGDTFLQSSYLSERLHRSLSTSQG